MTPRRIVEWHRWQVVGAFFVILLISIGLGVWTDYRDDQLEKRVTRNAARADDLRQTNQRQDEIRAVLLRGLEEADRNACLRIEKLKMQNRIDAQRSFDQLGRTLGLLRIEQTPEIVQAAAQELARDLRRNAPESCETR